LPDATKAIAQGEFNFWAIKSTFSWLQIPGFTDLVQGVFQSVFSLVL
jgi:hypothetical protein